MKKASRISGLLALLPFLTIILLLSIGAAGYKKSKPPANGNPPTESADGRVGASQSMQMRETSASKNRFHDLFETGPRAPEFPPSTEWVNLEKQLTLAELKGRFVLLDFWTYCCINCMHVLPDLKRLEEKYRSELVVIGVHSAKFQNERESRHIQNAIERYGIEHAVINDASFDIWNLYGARAWPTLMLIGPNGRIIGVHSGEGAYDVFDPLLREAIEYFNSKGELNYSPLHMPWKSRPLVEFADAEAISRQERNASPECIDIHDGRSASSNNESVQQMPLCKRSSKAASLSPLYYPGKITFLPKSHRLVLSDSGHHRILVLKLDGEIEHVIGSGQAGLRDGSFTETQFRAPQGVCADAGEEKLYISDTENHAVREIDLKSHQVKTIAGTGRQSRVFWLEGKGIDLNSPWDLLVMGRALFVAMAGSHQIYRIDLDTLEVKITSGTGREDLLDGERLRAALAQPSGIATDGKALFFVDSEASAVRAIDLSEKGEVRTLIGEGLFEFGDQDGAFTSARLQHPLGIAWHDGQLYIADTYNHKIKRMDLKARTIATWVGSGKTTLQDQAGERSFTEATLYEPSGLVFAEGKVYIVDCNHHLVRVGDLEKKVLSTLKIRMPK